MGAPVYDWLWFVPLLLVLVLFPLSYGLRFTVSRVLRWLYILLFAWLLIGYSALAPAQTMPLDDLPPLPLSFWVPGRSELLPAGLLADLADAQATLTVRVPFPLTGENRSSLLSLLRQLEAHQIPVVLFVPASDFLSLPVYEEWMVNVQETAVFLHSEQFINVRGVIGDAEKPRTAFYAFPATKLVEIQTAGEVLDGFLQEFHRTDPDLLLGVTASWPLFADQLDGDQDLAAFYRTAVHPPANWGFVSVMNYTSYYPASWRPYLLARIVWGMERLYPEQEPIHLIGIVGGGFPWEPVLDFEDVVADARLSRALGVPEVVVFQLKGALEKQGEDFVSRLDTAVNHRDGTISLPFSRPASIWLFGTAVLDALFDLFGARLWPVLAWMVVSLMVIWRRNYQFTDN